MISNSSRSRTILLNEMNRIGLPINYKSLYKYMTTNSNPEKNKCIWHWKTQRRVSGSPGQYHYERCGFKNTRVKMLTENYRDKLKEFPKNFVSGALGADEFTICNKHLKKFLGLDVAQRDAVKATKPFKKGDFVCGQDVLDISNLLPLQKKNGPPANVYLKHKYIVAKKEIKAGDELIKKE